MLKLTFSFTTEPDQVATDNATSAVVSTLLHKLGRDYPERAQEFVSHWTAIDTNTAKDFTEESIKLLHEVYGSKYIQKSIDKVARTLDLIL